MNQHNPRHHHTFAIGTILVMLGAIAFSAKALLVKWAYLIDPTLQAIDLMALRMAVALPVYLVIAWWLGRGDHPPLTGRERVHLLIIGLLGYYLASLLDFLSLHHITASLERLVLYLYPTMVILMSAYREGRRIGRAEQIALLVSYVGIAMVAVPDMRLGGTDVLLGVLLVFGSALSYSLFMVGNGVYVKRLGSKRFTTWSMLIATSAVLLHALIRRSLEADSLVPDWAMEIWIAGLALGLFSTVLASYLLNAGLARIGPSATSMISLIGPVSLLFFAYLFLGEELQESQWLGSLLVLGGVVATLKFHCGS